jgi:DNA-binding NarL/FixJ family response regulator
MSTPTGGRLAALERWDHTRAANVEAWKQLEGYDEGTPEYALRQAKAMAADDDETAAAVAAVEAFGARDAILKAFNSDLESSPLPSDETMVALAKQTGLPPGLITTAYDYVVCANGDEYAPALTVADADALPPDAPPVIPFLAWPGLKTVVNAREKAGKSTLAMAGAAAASRGDVFLGVQLAQKRVLWLSEESRQLVLKRAKAMRASPTHFHVVRMTADPLAQLVHYVASLKPDIVVIDTLWRFARASVLDENSSAQWTPVLDALERLADQGAAVLLLAHSSKAGEYRGSTAVGGFADVLVSMKTPKKGETIRSFDALGRIETTDAEVDLTEKPDGYVLVGAKTTDRTTDAAVDAKVLAYVQKHPGKTARKIRPSVRMGAAELRRSLARLVMADKVRGTGEPVTYTAVEAGV